MDLRTKRGYDFYEVTSTFQKAIRRNDPKIAGYFGLELFHSGYMNYVWKRMFTISAEDCDGIITKEIDSLYNGYMLINKTEKNKIKGRIFVSKAILLLCKHPKNRDADHLQNLVYDNKINITDDEIEGLLNSTERETIPDYAFDVHTSVGKRRGKTKKDFFEDELKNLSPREVGLFDSLILQKGGKQGSNSEKKE